MAVLRAFGVAPGFTAQTFQLPPRGQAIVGRLKECGVCLPDNSVRGQHCQLRDERGGWRLYDLSRGQGVFRRGERLDRPTLLMHGDVLQLGRVTLVFLEGHEAFSSELEAKVAAAPGDKAPLLVWADWLQEQQDPLGERISRACAGGELANEPWAEGLAEEEAAGRLDLEWKHGLIAGITLRTPRSAYPWELVLARALAVRTARFVERLTLDVLALCDLEPDLPDYAGRPRDDHELRDAWLPGFLEVLPSTLRRLEIGYTTEPGVAISLGPEQRRRFPRLEGEPVWLPAAKAVLRRTVKPEDVALDPDAEEIALAEGLRLNAAAKTESTPRTLRFEQADPLGSPRAAEFRTRNGRWTMTAGQARAVRVNGRQDSEVQLLPGDRIEVAGATYVFTLT